jgi:hypothetical protein
LISPTLLDYDLFIDCVGRTRRAALDFASETRIYATGFHVKVCQKITC